MTQDATMQHLIASDNHAPDAPDARTEASTAPAATQAGQRRKYDVDDLFGVFPERCFNKHRCDQQ